MSDLFVQQLLPASLDGIEFRVRNEIQTASGRRVVLHEYPKSNQRFVEDMGEIPPTFKVEAFVHGIDYLSKATQLENSLKKTGVVELVLPTFGAVQVYNMPFTKESIQTEVGEIIFSLEFATGRPIPGPEQRQSQLEDLYDETDRARANIQIALTLLWGKPETALNIAVAQYDTLQILQSSINQYVTLIDSPSLNAWQTKINSISDQIVSLVISGQSLASSLIQNTESDPGLWQQTSQGMTAQGLNASISGVNFGSDLSIQVEDISGAKLENIKGQTLSSDVFISDINLWPENSTASRNLRNKNRQLLVETYRVNSLILAYEQASALEYETEQQIVETRDQLYQAYDSVMRNSIEDTITSDPDVRSSVNEARFIASEILERKAQFSPGVTTLTLNSSLSALSAAYFLYAEKFTTSDELETESVNLRSLNPTKPSLALQGEITVFDQERSL